MHWILCSPVCGRGPMLEWNEDRQLYACFLLSDLPIVFYPFGDLFYDTTVDSLVGFAPSMKRLFVDCESSSQSLTESYRYPATSKFWNSSWKPSTRTTTTTSGESFFWRIVNLLFYDYCQYAFSNIRRLRWRFGYRATCARFWIFSSIGIRCFASCGKCAKR